MSSGNKQTDSVSKTAPCLEVMILWGSSVLHVDHASPPRPFHVSGPDAPASEHTFRLPSPDVEIGRTPIVKAGGETIALVLPEGATGWVEIAGEERRSVAEMRGEIAFPAGSRARIEAFGVTFAISLGEPGRVVAKHWFFDRKQLPYVIGSAALQLGLLGALSCFHGPPRVEGEPTAEQIHDMHIALAAATEKELEQLQAEEVTASNADSKEGGTGARARGEEGSMGAPSTRSSGARYGTAGPADPHLSRAQAMRESAEFGMVGLLNSGAGGDPNAPSAPWGRDDALGNDPLSARGNMMGLSGIGEGGGGRGEGLGLGSIGTLGHGAGAGSGQGFGSGAGRLGGRHMIKNDTVKGAAGATNAQPPPALTPVLPTSTPVQEIAIDPNGRFATTYRPGGGYLSAFESAVARGIVPAATREVVSDVGARYAPSVPVPDNKALGLRADLERAKIAPSGGPFHLRIALQSSPHAAAARPHLSIHLVLDVSGSMGGESISRAREAAEALVDKLAPSDDFSLTTFSSSAHVLVPDGPVGARRGEIKSAIHGVGVEGGTNIGEGLTLGYQQASTPSIPEDAVRVVLLLSDGRANEGITSSERLSGMALAAFQHGIQTSSFGLGSDYDGALMSSIAADGAGGYYYLRDASQIGPALATELEKRADPVATAVEVRVRLKKGVELLKVYGSRRLNEAESARVRAAEVAADAQAQKRDKITMNRQDDNEGGMRFFMPAFARDDSHTLLFKLKAPAGTGNQPLALVELKYKDRVGKKNVTEELPLTLAYADSDAASGATIDASVARTVQGFAAGEALESAARSIARGDRQGAIALLSEREEILRQAAATLNEPLFLRDAARLARLRGDAGSDQGLGEPLVLSMLLETAGRAHLR
jgi:hypothetical protein